MNNLPHPTLLDAHYSLEGNKKAFASMPEVVRMFQGTTTPMVNAHSNETRRGELDEIFDHLVVDREEYDPFHIFGEMVNQLIQTFPEMKEAWEKLSADQKWIFIEGSWYGCVSPILTKIDIGWADRSSE